jgi:hypothetical protein
MDDFWLMVKIILIVLAWGGLLLFVGYGLERLGSVFGRGAAAPGAEPPPRPTDAS